MSVWGAALIDFMLTSGQIVLDVRSRIIVSLLPTADILPSMTLGSRAYASVFAASGIQGSATEAGNVGATTLRAGAIDADLG